MKYLCVLWLLFLSFNINGQIVLDADGPGNTYSLITSVLAPGYNPIEVPDCNHTSFGDHIDEVYDTDLNINVFRFYIHVSPDDDRCINFDRQRNEIKTYNQSPDNLLGVVGEKVIYKWKFKLPSGFQSSSNFTHIHQLKSVGGPLASMPMYTLTTRKSNPDRLELRYAETDSQITLAQTDLLPLVDTWLDVTETIIYGTTGSYSIEIKQVSNNVILFTYSNNNIINWRQDAEFVRPKWGIYRSLNNVQDLRDESVLFANFSIEEVEPLSVGDSELNNEFFIFPNPAQNILQFKNVPLEANLIKVFSIEGRKIMDKAIDNNTDVILDVSSLLQGTYIINLSGKLLSQSKLIVISN
ncbi:hypothetical protein FBALC1_06823 [Flavobacteriales bacterium ALC-1]|nr:hypothetical protein FBALC1_06823 [Flavobacteriales bacterium ALC-1]